jgi:uncharacterized protein YraI
MLPLIILAVSRQTFQSAFEGSRFSMRQGACTCWPVIERMTPRGGAIDYRNVV